MLTESDYDDPDIRRRHLIWLLDNAAEARFLGEVTPETRERAAESLQALDLKGSPVVLADGLAGALAEDVALLDRTENNRATLSEGLAILIGPEGA